MFHSILLAVDLEDAAGAEKLADAAARLAAQDSAKLHVINVIPDMGMSIVGAAFSAQHSGEVLKASEKALVAFAAKCLPEGTKAHIARGTIYDQIIKSAEKLGCDMIVVGAHSPELRDYLVGPNAARIVRHAKQSVLVVR